MPKFWSHLFGAKPATQLPTGATPTEPALSVASYAEPMKWIVDQLAAQLRANGFKRKRNTFNRRAQDGIVHQISFDQMPVWSIGHGCFTLHGGVRVPENDNYTGYVPKSEWINSYDCSIRGIFGPDRVAQGNDAWRIQVTTDVVDDCRAALTRCLSILDQYPSTEAVVSQETPPEPFHHQTPRDILIACVLIARGEMSEAERTLEKYISANVESSAPRHLAYVLDWAAKAGLNVSSKP